MSRSRAPHLKLTQPASRDKLNAVDAALDKLHDRLERTRAASGLGDARRYLQDGRFAEAKTIFDELLPACPHMDNAWLEGAQLADAMGEATVAVDRYRHLLTLDTPLHEQAEAGLMTALMHAGDLAAAGRLAFKLTRRDGSDSQAWATLAVCAMQSGRSQLMWKAVESLRHSTDDLTARQAMAIAWRESGPFMPQQHKSEADGGWTHLVTWAANTLSLAARRMPSHADKHYHHAVCRLAAGEQRVARKSVTHALTLNPQYEKALRLQDLIEATDAQDDTAENIPFPKAA